MAPAVEAEEVLFMTGGYTNHVATAADVSTRALDPGATARHRVEIEEGKENGQI